jgi:hypothetical protein
MTGTRSTATTPKPPGCMTMRFAGVATGVRKDAAAATQTPIRNGFAETSGSPATGGRTQNSLERRGDAEHDE